MNFEQDRPFYEAAYNVLVEVGGAAEGEREGFVDYCTEERPHAFFEWRFRGHLGFGGKLRRAYRRFCVTYYPENHTPARDQIEATINERLEALAQKMSPIRVL